MTANHDAHALHSAEPPFAPDRRFTRCEPVHGAHTDVRPRRVRVGLPAGPVELLLLAALALGGSTPVGAQTASPSSDPTLLECGNLIYAGNKSSVCFADRFLTDVSRLTVLRVNPKFCPVRLESEALFDYPFCVMSGNEDFTLSDKERGQLRRYLTHGGFLLVSPGCSDVKWDKAFRREVQLCFPQNELRPIPMNHPVFSTVHHITRLTEKHGKPVMLEGLVINGRLALVYSKEGLNDVAHAKGCCCCGGNEIRDPARMNVNIFAYAVLY